MKDLDPKSLIIGILATVLVTVALGNAVGGKEGRYLAFTSGGKPTWAVIDTTNGDIYAPNREGKLEKSFTR
jgi:hypothetical protein